MKLKMEQWKLPNWKNREKMNRALETSELYRDPLKINRASETYGTVTENLAFVSSVTERKSGAKKLL